MDANFCGEASAPIRFLTYFATPIPAFANVVPSVSSIPSLRRYRRLLGLFVRVGLIVRSISLLRRSVVPPLSYLRWPCRSVDFVVPSVSSIRLFYRFVGLVIPSFLSFRLYRRSVDLVVPSVSSFRRFRRSVGPVVPSVSSLLRFCRSVGLVVPSVSSFRRRWPRLCLQPA